jgi:hypothetical protein
MVTCSLSHVTVSPGDDGVGSGVAVAVGGGSGVTVARETGASFWVVQAESKRKTISKIWKVFVGKYI